MRLPAGFWWLLDYSGRRFSRGLFYHFFGFVPPRFLHAMVRLLLVVGIAIGIQVVYLRLLHGLCERVVNRGVSLK